MASEIPDPTQFVTFEITAPLDDAQGIAALRGMVIALGWNARQRTTFSTDLDNRALPELWRIEDRHLLATSQELWGEEYGISAVRHLGDERSRAHGILWQSGRVNMSFPKTLQGAEVDGIPLIPLYVNDELNPAISLADRSGSRMSHEAMARAAQLLWDHNHYPFTVVATIREDSSIFKDDSMGLSAGHITRERLADYDRARGYDNHMLHGTLGKMLDVISVTAGVVRKDAVGDREFGDDFISRDDLEEMMKSAGVGDRTRRAIDVKLYTAIIDQLITGRPFALGEIVLEGGRAWQEYDRVALSSLSALARSYRGKRSQAALFLRQFV